MEPRRFDAMARLFAVRTHRRAVLSAALIGGILGRTAAPVRVRAAAQQAGVCDAAGATNFGSSGTPRYAATFASAVGGKLSRIDIMIDKLGVTGPDGDFVVALHAVDPTGVPMDKVLRRKTVPNDSVATGQQVVVQATFKKRKTVKLVKDKTYAVVISRPNANDNGAGYAVRGNTGNPCTNNRFFSSPQQAGTFQEGNLAVGFDMRFEVFAGF